MAVISDAWTWRQLFPDTVPPSRTDFGMVMADDRIVMFGGISDESPGPGTSPLDDVWEYYADDWHHVPNSGPWPSARYQMAMCWTGDKVLMTGGIDFIVGYPQDTWIYEIGVGWTQITTANYPDDSGVNYWPAGRTMNWDTFNDRALITAPYFPASPPTDQLQTWEFDFGSSDWAQLSVTPDFNYPSTYAGPFRRLLYSVFTGERWIVTCGAANDNANDVHELDVTTALGWAQPYVGTPASGAGTPTPFGTIQHQYDGCAVWTGDRMFMYGGTFQAHSGTPIYTIDRQFQYAVGGAVEELVISGTPSQRTGHRLIWDGSRVLMFGGITGPGSGDILHETWVLEPPLVASIKSSFGLGT